MIRERQKQTGSFYTQSKIAESIVNWAIRSSSDCILEPSFGDGIFIDKSFYRYKTFGNANPNITAVEIQPEIVERVRMQLPLNKIIEHVDF